MDDSEDQRAIHLERLDAETLSAALERARDPAVAAGVISALDVTRTISLAADVRAMGYGYYWLTGPDPQGHGTRDALLVLGGPSTQNDKMTKDLIALSIKTGDGRVAFKPAGTTEIHALIEWPGGIKWDRAGTASGGIMKYAKWLRIKGRR